MLRRKHPPKEPLFVPVCCARPCVIWHKIHIIRASTDKGFHRQETSFCVLHAGQRELQVLDYQNVAHTLIGLTASAYACWFMGQEMQARYQK
jgi:hypothetical protein